MGIKRGPTLVRDGLVLHLDAANPRSYPGSGTTWFDLSGNNSHGEIFNGTTYSSAAGGRFIFDGLDDSIGINNVTFTGAFGVTCFFNLTYSVDVYTVLGRSTNVIGPSAKLIFLGSNIFFRAVDGGGNANWDFGYTSDRNGKWNFLAFYRAAGGQLYASLNGGDWVYGGVITGDFEFNRIGRNADAQYWLGSFANMQIYNRALTTSEILQNYTAQKSRFGL